MLILFGHAADILGCHQQVARPQYCGQANNKRRITDTPSLYKVMPTIRTEVFGWCNDANTRNSCCVAAPLNRLMIEATHSAIPLPYITQFVMAVLLCHVCHGSMGV